MRKTIYLTAIILLIGTMILSGTLFAQRPGRVAGSVVEKVSKNQLIGANSILQGTGYGAVSDNQGDFLIGAVPAGQYTVIARYIGYETATQSITVESGRDAIVQFELAESVVKFGEVTVSADRMLQSQSAALNAQYNASNIKNVISADLMGTFPDEEAVEAIQRIPGVVVDGGEAIMRGMPAEWSLVTLNGEKIPSVNAAVDRSDPLETFPIDLIQAIEVSKGQTADMDADAIAGNVNFILKDAPNRRIMTAKAYIGTTEDRTSKWPIHQVENFGPMKFSLTLGDAFQDGKLGYSIAGTYENENSSNYAERFAYDFSNNYWPRYQASKDRFGNATSPGLRYHRDAPTESSYKKAGFNTSILYKPALGHKFMLKTFFSSYNLTDNDLELTDRYTYINKKKFYDGYYSKLNDVKHEPKWVANIALGGEHMLWGNWNVDYAVHYTAGRGGESHDIQTLFATKSYAAMAAGNDTMFFDNNNFEDETFKEDDRIVAMNIKKPFGSGSLSGYLKSGFKYKSKDRFQSKLDSEVGPLDPADLEDAEGYKYWTTFEQDPYLFEWDPPSGLLLESDNSTTLDENYTANETIAAAYIMSEIWLGNKLMLLPGFRMEKTKTTAKPRLTDLYLHNNPEEAGRVSAIEASGTYTDYFPSFHLRYKLPADINFRASYSKGISRPSFRLFVGYNDYDPNNLELVTGNPNLIPTRATNFDLILEKYSPDMASHMSAGFFMKKISDVMEQVYYTFPEEENKLWNGYHVTQVEVTENVGTGYAKGIELSLQRQLDFLGIPQVGILSNWTHQLDTYMKNAAGVKSQLPRQADDVVNAALSLELANIGFSGRISYLWKSRVFQGLIEYGEEWREAQKQLDFVLRQRINKHVRVFLNGRNLLDEDPLRWYKGMRPEFPTPLWVKYNINDEGREFYGGFEFNL